MPSRVRFLNPLPLSFVPWAEALELFPQAVDFGTWMKWYWRVREWMIDCAIHCTPDIGDPFTITGATLQFFPPLVEERELVFPGTARSTNLESLNISMFGSAGFSLDEPAVGYTIETGGERRYYPSLCIDGSVGPGVFSTRPSAIPGGPTGSIPLIVDGQAPIVPGEEFTLYWREFGGTVAVDHFNLTPASYHVYADPNGLPIYSEATGDIILPDRRAL